MQTRNFLSLKLRDAIMLENYLNQLPEYMQTIFRLRHHFGFSQSEIADATARSISYIEETEARCFGALLANEDIRCVLDILYS